MLFSKPSRGDTSSSKMHLSFVLPELIVLVLLNVQALANSDLDKRLVCVKDDLYDGFHNADPEDINPWCSSYLGIPEYTATRVGGTSRTWVELVHYHSVKT